MGDVEINQTGNACKGRNRAAQVVGHNGVEFILEYGYAAQLLGSFLQSPVIGRQGRAIAAQIAMQVHRHQQGHREHAHRPAQQAVVPCLLFLLLSELAQAAGLFLGFGAHLRSGQGLHGLPAIQGVVQVYVALIPLISLAIVVVFGRLGRQNTVGIEHALKITALAGQLQRFARNRIDTLRLVSFDVIHRKQNQLVGLITHRVLAAADGQRLREQPFYPWQITGLQLVGCQTRQVNGLGRGVALAPR